MTKSLKALPGKVSKPRGRNGGRKPAPESERKVQANIWLPRWLNEGLRVLLPTGEDRNNLVASWVRAYLINHGESDRLLMQSSVAVEILAYLESTDAPQELIDKVESAIVARVFDDAKIAEGVSQVGESFIV